MESFSPPGGQDGYDRLVTTEFGSYVTLLCTINVGDLTLEALVPDVEKTNEKKSRADSASRTKTSGFLWMSRIRIQGRGQWGGNVTG